MLRFLVILLLLPFSTISQNKTSIQNEYFKIFIDSVQFKETVNDDTINLEITSGIIEGKTLQIAGANISNIAVSQCYINAAVLGTDTAIIELDDWKSFTSQWHNTEPSSKNKFQILKINKDDRKQLPGFTESDLKGHLVSKGLLDYSELMSNETFNNSNKNYWIDTNNIIIRLSGKDTENRTITMYLNFILPQGC